MTEDQPLFTLNQRVMTPLGAATVLGFETFFENGNQGPNVMEDPGPPARVIVKLDDPSRWIPTPLTPHPYMFRRNVSVIHD